MAVKLVVANVENGMAFGESLPASKRLRWYEARLAALDHLKNEAPDDLWIKNAITLTHERIYRLRRMVSYGTE